MRYAFIKEHRTDFRITSMCRVLHTHRSGFYAWLKKPISTRAQKDRTLYRHIHHYWNESEQTYGSPRIHRDLAEAGISCGLNRVAKIMRHNGLKAILGCKSPRFRYGKPAVVAENHLEQNFGAEELNSVWVIDITYVPTKEGWLYLAAVMDLCSRRIVGWSMGASLHRDLVIQALLMAVWNRRPKNIVLVHSNQGSQFGSDDWVRFCRDHGLERSMSRRGNCYDNAAIESFFGSLKKERVRRRSYQTRAGARADIFDYIEVFYNRKRRYKYLDYMSPVEYEEKLMAS
jgi:putative transposase